MAPEDAYPVRWAGRQALVALPEHIDVSNAGQIREELLSVINRGAEALIADMTATLSCDNAGADAVARAYQRAVTSRIELRLVVTSGVVLRMLGMTGVGRLVPVYPSVEAALAARSPAVNATLTVANAGTTRGSRRRRMTGAAPGGSLQADPDVGRPGPTLARVRPGSAVVMSPGVLWNVIEAFSDGVALADGEGTLVLASRHLEEMFGYPPTELTGQPLEHLIPAHLQAARARSVGTGALLTGLHKDGTTFPVEISISPVQTATGRFCLAVVRDMTAVRSLADVDAAAAAASSVHRCQELLDTIITRLFQVGVSLQKAADLSRDTARPHLEEALRVLDGTISQIRDTTFAAQEDSREDLGPRDQGPPRAAWHAALFALCPNVSDGGPGGVVTSGHDGGGVGGGRLGARTKQSTGADRPGPRLQGGITMRRNSRLSVLAGFAVAVILLAAGGLLLWGSTYVHNTVQGQLAAQQIFFPPKAAFAHPVAGTEITPSMIPSVSQYAGQQLLTGQQAEAYADHFIAVHVTDMSGGKTYSQLSAESIAQPNNAKLAGLVATVFKGETLRSMLLNAYGWWKVSQITYIAAIVAFALGGLALLASLFGLTIGRHPEIVHEIIDGTPVTHA